MTGWIPTPLLAFSAKRRRAAGDYTRETLAAYAAAWRRCGSAGALLRYALFRRDLGRKLPRRWVAPLLAAACRLRARDRALALALAAETDPGALAGVPREWLESAKSLPVVAAFLEAGQDGPDSRFGRVHRDQPEWRKRFIDWLITCRTSGICVVGNAAGLHGASLGKDINAAGAVVRFNLFRSAETSETDVGSRTDVWVASPGFRGACPAEVKWVVVAGPDMRFRLQDWRVVMPLLELGCPVLTVPLPIWRALVRVLKAPPSAGVLMLAWVRDLLGGWEGVVNAGVGMGVSNTGRYHGANPRQHAVSRHNWEAERALIRHWQEEGLQTISG